MQWEMDMRFGIWNVRSLYVAGSVKPVASKLAKYKLDIVGVQEFSWDKFGVQPAGGYTFFYGNWNANRHLVTRLFVYNGIRSRVKRVEFISDRMTYIRGRWCDIIVLNGIH
jgi:hypothetical protein